MKNTINSGIVLEARLRQLTQDTWKDKCYFKIEHQEVVRLWSYEDFITLVNSAKQIKNFMCKQWSKVYLDIYKHIPGRWKHSFDFQSTWLSNRGIPPLKYDENSKSHTQPIVKLQWLNLCGRTGLQSSRLLPTNISGLCFAFRTTASNHKVQTTISIEEDRTKKVMNCICILRGEQDTTP